VKIARASIHDIEALIALHRTGFEVAWDRATFQEFLDNGLIWVAFGAAVGAAQANTLGFIIVRQTLDEAEVITLVVASNARGKGLGSALLARAVDHLLTCNVSQVFLEVAQDNLSAVALYQRAGFVQIGQRRGYYHRKVGPDIDALVLSFRPDYTEIVANN
jgi:[ribosomal protein S18]-alanine N-acetyltransferase